jgi:thiamine pyrophosphokinase
MSSHHIVRDQQEPALVIHRLDQFPMEKLGELLEWSPTIICCGHVLQEVLDKGIKVDIAIIPFESRDRFQDMLMAQSPIRILTLSQPDFLASGLQILIKEGHFAANIVTASEMVPEVLDLCQAFTGDLQLGIWDESQHHTIIQASPFIKWFPKDSELEFFALSDQAHLDIRTEEHQLQSLEFVTHTDGKIVVNFDQAPIVLVENYTTD